MNPHELFDQINTIKEAYYRAQLRLEDAKTSHSNTKLTIKNTMERNSTTSNELPKLQEDKRNLDFQLRESVYGMT